MALQDTITHKGIQLNAYIKATVGGVHGATVNVPGPNYIAPVWADPAHPTEEEKAALAAMLVPEKRLFISYTYSIKANATAPQFDSGSGQVEYDKTQDVFTQAYAAIAAKYGITNTMV